MFWPSQQAVLLADTHFGKAATFRNGGIPVPAGTTEVMLKKISDTIDRTRATSVYFLGDFCHSFSRYEEDFVSDLMAWRKSHRNIEMTLILGNHDLGQRSLFHQLNLTVVEEPFLLDGIALCHYPETVVPEGVYKLAGHVHPSFSLAVGGDSLTKIPCFHFSETVGVLPAFGEFTGTHRIKPQPSDHVFAVADDQVFSLVGPAQTKTAAN
jgi:DNA ligase-associated metallophosphoesterase